MLKKEKLSIIYEPSSYIEDAKLLTSLCIYYDDIKLFSHKTSENDYKLYQFMQGPYKILNKEGILSLYTPDDIQKYFPKANELEISIDDVTTSDSSVILKVSKISNSLTQRIIKSLYNARIEKPQVSDLIRAINVFSVAESYDIPILTDKGFSVSDNSTSKQIKSISDTLAVMTISNIALPELKSISCEDILAARQKLKDELLEFKTGILDLTYYLCKNTDIYNIADIYYECNLLIETKIKASVLNLENAIRKHKSSRIRNLIFNSAKLLLTGSNLFLANKSIRDITSDLTDLLDISKSYAEIAMPEQKIATYMYKVDKIFD